MPNAEITGAEHKQNSTRQHTRLLARKKKKLFETTETNGERLNEWENAAQNNILYIEPRSLVDGYFTPPCSPTLQRGLRRGQNGA